MTLSRTRRVGAGLVGVGLALAVVGATTPAAYGASGGGSHAKQAKQARQAKLAAAPADCGQPPAGPEWVEDTPFGVPSQGRVATYPPGAFPHYETGITQVLSGSARGDFDAATDQFGATTATALLNSDYCDDVLVGAPAASGGGAVHIYFGNPSYSYPNVPDLTLHAQTAADDFGASLAVAARPTVEGDPWALTDVWVGAPGRTVGGQANAGAVDHYVVDGDGDATLVESLTQASAVLAPGAAQADAHFGQVLAATTNGLLVGVPDEDLSPTVTNSGAAYWLTRTGSGNAMDHGQSLDQSITTGLSPEAGDHFGASVAVSPLDFSDTPGKRWALVGAPYEDVKGNTVKNAGVVSVLELKNNALVGQGGQPWAYLSQDSAGVPGAAETGDHFGAAVAAGTTRTDNPFLVGAPGEDLGQVKDAGSVTAVYAPGNTLFKPFSITQRKTASLGYLSGTPEAGDEVGATLANEPGSFAGEDSGELYLIGAPGETLGRGDKHQGTAYDIAFGDEASSSSPIHFPAITFGGQAFGGVLPAMDPTYRSSFDDPN